MFNLYNNSHISVSIQPHGIQTWHDVRRMHDISAHARFDDLYLDTRSQLIGRGKQYLSYSIQTAHGGRLMHAICAQVRLDDLNCPCH